jgi:predicted MFS family arabinose efflux permease
VSPDRRKAALTPALIFIITVVAVISSLGAPLLPSISRHLHVSVSTAQWSLTATVMVGAVSASIMGRMGDGPYRRQTMIAGLAAVTLGGIVAASAHQFTYLVIGRALQGVGLGLVPLAMAAARDHLPQREVQGAIAVLSVSAAAGVGVGYPVSGLIDDVLGLSAAFWFGAIFSGVALVCAVVLIPSSAGRPKTVLDVPGIALITVALLALLLAIAQGSTWGWSSSRILGLLAVALITSVLWVLQELRAEVPLVELRLLRHHAVLVSDVCTLILGVAMYMNLTAVVEFVQAPATAGYGFSASVVVSGLCLVPFSITSFAASRTLPWMVAHVGRRALLPLGSLVVALAGAFFAILHGSLWQAFVMMAILGVGLGLTAAALPGLIVGAVPEEETGSALGFYQVLRYIGFALGSAVAASVLASRTPPGSYLPEVGGYTMVLWIGAAVCVAAAVMAWVLPTRRAEGSMDDQVAEINAELAPTGFVDVQVETGGPASAARPGS